jgi:hypothetical protein
VIALKEREAFAEDQVSNGAEWDISSEIPYVAHVKVVGVAPILFHAWNVEAVEEKAKAAKGSKAKKSDDVESYVYRNSDGEISVPGDYFRGTLVTAARYRQDPRSPRKSAMDLVKAGIAPLTDMCSFGVKDWDYLDRRRVTVQRAGITRTRPALREGWHTQVDLAVLTPEYISPAFLNDLLQLAGKLSGLADFRPTYGRFQVVGFSIMSD